MAEVQAQQSSRQSAVDEGLHICEQAWRALTQLQAAVSSDAGQSSDDHEFLLEFNTQLTLLSHVPDPPSVEVPMHLAVEDAIAVIQQLSFAVGDDALHMSWKTQAGTDISSRQADLRVKELAAQLQMVSADNARREDDILAANKRIRQMEEQAAAHAAEELRLQVLVERQKTQVQQLQNALDALTAEMKDKEIQHRQDVVEMQDLSAEKEHLLMTLMQESEEDHKILASKHDEATAAVEHLKRSHEEELVKERRRADDASKAMQQARTQAAQLTAALDSEVQRTEEVRQRWMEDLAHTGQVCQRINKSMAPVEGFLEKYQSKCREFSQAYQILARDLVAEGATAEGAREESSSMVATETLVDVEATLAAAVVTAEQHLFSAREGMVAMVDAVDGCSPAFKRQADEVEAALRDEYRLHLQRNFMIWYKEEQHLKEQLSIAKALVKPLEREVDELRQISSEAKALARELRRVQSLFDIIYEGTENVERQLRSRGCDLVQLREEVALVMRLVQECKTPQALQDELMRQGSTPDLHGRDRPFDTGVQGIGSEEGSYWGEGRVKERAREIDNVALARFNDSLAPSNRQSGAMESRGQSAVREREDEGRRGGMQPSREDEDDGLSSYSASGALSRGTTIPSHSLPSTRPPSQAASLPPSSGKFGGRGADINAGMAPMDSDSEDDLEDALWQPR